MISHTNTAINEGLYAYGLHLGNAFQLIDDALDYCSDAKTLGKNVGDDLADGKATLPLLHVLKHGTIDQQAMVKHSLEHGTLQHLPEIMAAIAETHAIEFTHSVAENEVDLAIEALSALPDSVYKEALAELARYAVKRDH